jgi:hypothetical protein
MKKYVQVRLTGLPQEHVIDYKEYLYQICALKGSGEYGINNMFDRVLFSYTPLVQDIETLREKFDLSFFYGTRDWMDLDFDGESISTILKKIGVKVYMIDDADHHIYFDNPEQTQTNMIEELSSPFRSP